MIFEGLKAPYRSFFLYLLLGLALPLYAQEALHSDVKSDLRYVVDRVDELLGGKRTDDNKSRSTLRLTASEQIADRQIPQFAFDVGFIMKLQTITGWQDDLQNWFRRQWRNIEGPTSNSKKAAEVTATAKSDRSVQPERDPWRFSLDKHLTVARKMGLQIYPRLRKDFETKYLVNTLLLQAGWSIRDQWDSQITWVTSVKTHRRFLINWANTLRWQITNQIMSTSHGPGFSYLISERQVLTGLASVNTGISRHSWGVESYSGTVTYRLAAIQEWFFVSTNPYISFLRTEQFHRDLGFTISMEAVF